MKHKRESIKQGTNKSNIKDNNKNEQQNEVPKKIYQTNYQTSEGVIKFILDKIITSAVRFSQSKEIDEQMGIFCFDNFKKQMTSLFETNFINYTDDLPHDEPKLLWEAIPPPENTWIEILEPGSQEMDRYESSNIEFVEIKKDQQVESAIPSTAVSTNSKDKKNVGVANNLNKKIGKKEFEPLSLNNNNIINEVEEKSSISGFDGEMILGNGAIPEVSGIEDEFSDTLNITDAEIKKNIDKAQEIAQKDKKEKSDKKNKNSNKNLKTNIENIPPKKEEEIKDNDKKEEKKENINPKSSIPSSLPPIKKKGKNIPIIDYPCTDIPGVEEEYNHDNYEPQNVEFLRREREELIQKKILENKLKETTNKVIKPIEENDKIRKKLIDTNRLTFDSNGNIIHFRPYKFDNLSKDFVMTRNTIRGFENKQDINYNTNKKRNINKEKKEKEKEINPEEIIKNIEEEKKIKEINNITTNVNTDKDRFVPSGSNFQIISPNIGVVIKENNQAKEGPKEFSKYFNKYSLQDYDKMLNDFVPLQNRTMLQKHLNTSSSNNNSKYLSTAPNNNTMINKRSSKMLSALESSNNLNINTNNSELPANPLLPNEDQSSYFIDKDKSINNSGFNMNSNMNSNLNINLNNPLLSSNMNSMNFNRYNESYNSINMDNSIVMKKLGTGSLKLELDSLRDLSTINADIIKIPNKRKNIFSSHFSKGNKTYKIKPQNEKNNFNDFNKKIMVTSGWGNDTGDNLKAEFKEKSNAVYSRHITKQQVLRELGSNILSGIKVRLPRERKVDINNNI